MIIIDYGMGNLGSIQNMLKKVGTKSIITSNTEEIKNAEKIILPGVGSFDNAIENLKKLKLLEVISTKALKEKVPILGICLGMQLLAKKSEEGEFDGLKLIDAEVVHFDFSKQHENLKIPHMGWNHIKIMKKSLLLKDMYDDPRFYFVHSYYLKCNDSNDILCTTNYGNDFVSAVEKENIMGVQFHPEKSHKFGMKLLKNFSEL